MSLVAVGFKHGLKVEILPDANNAKLIARHCMLDLLELLPVLERRGGKIAVKSIEATLSILQKIVTTGTSREYSCLFQLQC